MVMGFVCDGAHAADGVENAVAAAGRQDEELVSGVRVTDQQEAACRPSPCKAAHGRAAETVGYQCSFVDFCGQHRGATRATGRGSEPAHARGGDRPAAPPERRRGYGWRSRASMPKVLWVAVLALLVPCQTGSAFLRIDPEYTCVYSDYRTDLMKHFGAVSSSSQSDFLSVHTPQLQVTQKMLGSAVTDSITEDHWHDDVGRRYKELIPPNHPLPGALQRSIIEKQLNRSWKRRMMSAQDLHKDLLNSLTPPGETDTLGREKVEEAVLVLDLDKCSFWGSDGNDLGIALQWMEKGPELVHELYRMLLNPQVKATYERLQERAKKVRVVIYTMRATFLVYHSCFRDVTLPLRWEPQWHRGAQVFIPPTAANAEDVMRTYSLKAPLLEDERQDLHKSFERLLATRAVIAEELGLDSFPHLVVTATPKDVESTMRHLGIPLENAYLWDDNDKLRDDPRVVHVEHFDALPFKQAGALVDFLDKNCPAHELEEDLVDFMMGADPADVVIEEDGAGMMRYRIPACHEVREWALPCLVQTTMYQDRAAKGLACLEMERRGVGGLEAEPTDMLTNGYLSPVTPEHEFLTGRGSEAANRGARGGSGGLGTGSSIPPGRQLRDRNRLKS
jgi:hypothetical protein